MSDFLAEVVLYTEGFKTGRIYQQYAGVPSLADNGRKEKDNFSLSANLAPFDKRSGATQSRWSSRSEAGKNDLLTVIPQLGFDLSIKLLGKVSGFFAFIVYFALLVLEMFIPYYLITGFLSALKPEQEKPQEEAKREETKGEPQEVAYKSSFEEPFFEEFYLIMILK